MAAPINEAEQSTYGRARLSFAKEADIEEFVRTLEKYERGEMTPDQWRTFRLVRGTYGQRQAEDAQMLRVKVPQGVITTAQLNALADVGEQYSRGFGHITTRQNIQFHFVKLHDVEPAMRLLADSGLTTREACGNSVRNITGCPYAGVGADEVFDVTPYAEGLTRYLLRHKLSGVLPRKFKIAFEGCATDHIATHINDLAFLARVSPTGGRGFRVIAGGGTALMCTEAGVIHEFLPASEILRVADAVLRVFHRYGDYQHKQRNRTKFMIKSLGWGRWKGIYEQELAKIRLNGEVPTLEIDTPAEEPAPAARGEAPVENAIASRVMAGEVRGPGITPVVVPVLNSRDEDFTRWKTTAVVPQKQKGYVTVLATIPLGDFTSPQMRVLGELAASYGDGSIRVTMEQNLMFRWVKTADVRALYSKLAAAGLGLAAGNTVADVASCPGAESCRLAVTQSRGLGKLLEDTLRARPDLIEKADGARIKISGCPNGCGQHHIATIGFQGSIRRLGSKPIPQYFVMVGGGTEHGGATFGRLASKIPARRIPEAVERLIDLYAKERNAGESAPDFFRRVSVERVRLTLADLERLTQQEAVVTDFVDLAESAEFAPEVMDGECSA
ncbi:MAG TPA: nitrite/sulfite reductase [Vicinamibacterales bacterium]|nr:nitrite/sulfite reductase [Vicinamibacterales bacterium]